MLVGGLVLTPAAAAQEDVPTLTVQVELLKVRSGPDAGYPAFDSFEQGQTRGVIGYNAKTGWWQVVSTFGSPGWVNGNEVTVNQAAEQKFISPAPAASAVAPTVPVSAGNTLVFQTAAGGAIYAINADGSNLRFLAQGMEPALSPDGQQVAFVRWDGADFGALFTINSDGSNEKVIAGDIRQPRSPAWSADGQEIIISFQHGGLRDPEEECRRFDFDDGIRLPDGISKITSHRVTANGITICYILKEDLRWGLRRINVTTGRGEDMPHDLYSVSPTWNPAAPWQVVYDGARGLVSLDLNLGTSWALTADINDHSPVISPDGAKIAVTHRQGTEGWNIQVMNIDGSGRVQLTGTSYMDLVQQQFTGVAPHSYSNVSPAWSPDGTRLAFATNRRGSWEIWVMNADGSLQTPLVSSGALAAAGITLQFDGMEERMVSW
jgi:dipeptidyl aminopeptidase/acylaminoacyl peptidase